MRARKLSLATRSMLAVLAVLALFVAACSLGRGSVAVPTPTATAPGAARFQQSTCPFPLESGFHDGGNVRCGALLVPEDRTNPTGARISVAAAIFKTPAANPAPDPIIFLQGGPGGRLIEDFAPLIMRHTLDLAGQFGNHDVILIDQRGTGYSRPSLQCDEVVRLEFLTDRNISVQQAVDEQNKALAACHDRLTGAGVNLAAYTTASDAGDVHDLIAALGYKQVDLYGVSYGTRLALEIMRAYPAGVRSVVLDSTVPAQSHLLTSIPADMRRVFGTLFAGCAADAACNAKYPGLESTFYALVTRLNGQPVTFKTTDLNTNKTYTVVFKGDDLVNLLFQGFYAAQLIPLLPAMIDQANRGDFNHLVSLLYGGLVFDTSVSWGVYFSVECAEDVSYATADAVDAAAQTLPAAIRDGQRISLEGEIPACTAWNVGRAPASEGQPVASDIPALILEGEYDPVTPPANGDLAAQTLSHSYHYLFPATGHAVLLFNPSDCPTTVALAFWKNPAVKPDGACIAAMGEPRFQ
jgi:pimeloyl-ACP methyl ester carboxylesterase